MSVTSYLLQLELTLYPTVLERKGVNSLTVFFIFRQSKLFRYILRFCQFLRERNVDTI